MKPAWTLLRVLQWESTAASKQLHVWIIHRFFNCTPRQLLDSLKKSEVWIVSFMCLCHDSVLDDQQNVRPIKELLQMLYISLCTLVQDMGKSVLVGNINIWVHRMENIMQWQQQLDNIQINRVNTPT